MNGALLFLLVAPSLAFAHSAGIGTASIRALDDTTFEVRVRLPAAAAPVRASSGIVSAAEVIGAAAETRIITTEPTLRLDVGRHPLVARYPNEPPRVLEELGGWVEVPLRTPPRPFHFFRWLRDGVVHILSGPDHLLFLLGLCLLGSTSKTSLIAQVTVFTVAHSLSLALAAFDVVRLPAPPVEACIALSIAWVGWAALRRESHGLPVVFAFGLFHGLGFASLLTEAGLPPSSAALALIGFNLGVEAGQLLVLLALVPLLSAATRQRAVLAYILGCSGVAWTLVRVTELWS